MEDLLEKFKAIPLKKRLLLVALAALFYPALTYFDEAEDADLRLSSAVSRAETEKVAFEKAREKVKNLPNLEARADEINGKLAAARKYLPAALKFDEILRTFGRFEKELDVKIVRFEPGVENQGDQNNRYFEVPLTLELKGEFPNIMAFLDRIAHLENIIHIVGLDFKQAQQEVRNPNEPPEAIKPKEDSKNRIQLVSNLIFYRSMGN